MHFTHSQKLWLTSLSLFHVFNHLAPIFINLFIWQSTPSLDQLLKYHLSMFIAIPFLATLSGWLCKKYSPGKIYSFGLIMNGTLLLAVAAYGQLFINHITIFGLLNGAAIGMFSLPANLLNIDVAHNSLEKINSTSGAIFALASIVVPSLAALGLTIGISYSALFVFSAVCLLLSSIFSLSLSSLPKESYEPFFGLSLALQNPNWKTVFAAYLLHGIKGGVLWSLGPVIAISVVGQVSSWGLYILAFSLVSVGFNLLLTKVLNWHTNRSFIITSGILFSLACIIFGVNYNFYSFLWYSLFLTIDIAVTNAAFVSSTQRVIEADPHYTRLKDEYLTFLEYPLGIGRLMPMTILIYSQNSITSPEALRFAVITIGAISTLMFSILYKPDFKRYL
jgi:hypothetical protein